MTLYKKAVVTLVLLLMLVLTATLVAVFDESREYIEDELFAKAQNSASVLGVSMSQVEGDTVRMSVMADAVFDTGFYRKIELKSMKGEPIFVKSLQDNDSGVPDWFVSLLDLSAPKGVSQVSDGWMPVGILEVESNIYLAYEYLYSLFKRVVIIFSISFLLGAVLVVWILRMLLKPLERVKDQAEEVLKNRFLINEEIPDTRELRVVTKAVNALVGKMKQMYSDLVEITERNRRLEYLDKNTPLYNRKYLFMKYDSCKAPETKSPGVLTLFRVCGMEEANSAIGYDRVNKIVKELAESLHDIFSGSKRSAACRLSGREFAVLLPDTEIDDAAELSSRFLEKCVEIINKYPDIAQTLFVKGAVAHCGEDLSKLLSSLDLALNGAIAREPVVIVDDELNRDDLPVRKDEWRKLIWAALKEERFEVSLKDIFGLDGKCSCIEPSFGLIGGDGKIIDQKIYMPLVCRLGIFEKFNRFRLETLLRVEGIDGQKLVLEFPYEYIDSIHGLEEVAEYSKWFGEKGVKLVVEVSQYELAKRDHTSVKKVFDELSSRSIEAAIGSFEADSTILGLLKSIRPHFVRMKRDYYQDSGRALQDSTYLLLKSIGATLVLDGEESTRR